MSVMSSYTNHNLYSVEFFSVSTPEVVKMFGPVCINDYKEK